MKRRVGVGLVLLVVSIALLGVARGQDAPSPPTGWSKEDWASLPLEKQQQVLASTRRALDEGGLDAKADYLESDTPPSSEAEQDEPLLGILDMQAAPLSSEVYTISNRWQSMNQEGSLLTQVFAGASALEPEQGLIVVLVTPWPPGDQPGDESIFETPGMHGAVALDSVSGRVLYLVAEDGSEFAFDLDRSTWE